MKTLLLSLAVLMTAGKVPTGFAETTGESLYSEENEILLDEEKEYCPADINSLFADDRVLVTLKSRNSNPEGIPDEVIASLFEGINYSCCRDLSKVTLNDSLKEYYRKHPFHQIYRLDLTNGSKEKVLDACARLNEIDEVLSATPDYYCEAESLTPSDGEYHEQWGLHGTYGINAPAAWDVTTGEERIVTVGIIDTGIYSHTDLNDNLVPGWDFYYGKGVTNDGTSDHGTHVAGIVAACANNGGIVGVAPRVKICPLQVLSPFVDEHGTPHMLNSDLAAAINFATGLWGTTSQISVLNQSTGGYGSFWSSGIRTAISNFPGLHVWSAGNQSTNLDSLDESCLTSLSNCIGVGAINEYGSKCGFSNYGDSVSIYAPGDDILSTVANNGYGKKSGTSMAAPFVTGTAALVYSINPSLEGDQVKQAIMNGARGITIVGNNGSYYSSKLLDANGALRYAKNTFTQTKMPLRLGVKGKNGNTWKIEIRNPNASTVYAAYNSKTCNEADAKNFNGLYDVKVVTIDPLSSETVDITINGLANYVAAAFGYERSNRRRLMISCAGGPNATSLRPFSTEVFTNEIDYESRLMNKNSQYSKDKFKAFSSVPYDLSLRVVTKASWWGPGKIEIRNTWRYEVGIRYRTKLCTENDAMNFIESDVLSCTIRSGEVLTKEVSANFLADSYAACVNYYYHGFYYSKVSYIPSLANNNSYRVNVIMLF